MPVTHRIQISIPEQVLELTDDTGSVLRHFAVSTAGNGPGEIMDSECTPRGAHVIRAKIGAGEPLNTVFVGRRPTGELFHSALRDRFPGRDWILTRILWLSGTEPGFNRLGRVDSMRRYIYIHGTPDDVDMGRPGSRGCIRMRNEELIDLFDIVEVGTPVMLHG